MTTSEMTSEQKFDRRFSLLTDCGAMDDKNWKKKEVRHRTIKFLQQWERMQKGMTHMTSPITYVQLKEDRKGVQKEVLEAAKQEDIDDTFTVIKSHENHHAIIDERGEILGYRYRIKPQLLETLAETTSNLPHTGINAGNRGNYGGSGQKSWDTQKKKNFATLSH